MLKKIGFTFLICCFICTGKISAQNISGHWFGVGKVELPGSSNNYMTELIITQKGKLITGYLQYYFRDSLFNIPVTGTFEATTRRLHINAITLIHHSTTNTKIGIDCPVVGDFIVRVAKTESVLTGYFTSTKEFKYTCPPVAFKLKLSTAEEYDKEGEDTTKTEPPIQDTVVAKTETKEEKKVEEFNKREKEYFKTIEIADTVLRLEFYDNGSIDYDEISVFFNGKLILPKAKLTHKAIRIKVNLNTALPYNELSIFAESVGTTPPNTAALIIYDGTTRHDIVLTSDYNKNATLKLVSKKY